MYVNHPFWFHLHFVHLYFCLFTKIIHWKYVMYSIIIKLIAHLSMIISPMVEHYSRKKLIDQ